MKDPRSVYSFLPETLLLICLAFYGLQAKEPALAQEFITHLLSGR